MTPAAAHRLKLNRAQREKAGRAPRVNILRALRERAGMTIEDVSKRTRRGVPYLKALECPSALLPPPVLARLLAALYGVNYMDLYTGTMPTGTFTPELATYPPRKR